MRSISKKAEKNQASGNGNSLYKKSSYDDGNYYEEKNGLQKFFVFFTATAIPGWSPVVHKQVFLIYLVKILGKKTCGGNMAREILLFKYYS